MEMLAKAFAAALSIATAAMAAGYAQSKIGSAGAGTIAEKPETAGQIIVMIALPEVIAVLGFVVAAMIITILK